MTGYERAELKNNYYLATLYDFIGEHQEDNDRFDDNFYNEVNYYSSKTVAENNARADRLMRKLRRFAVENRKQEIDWSDPTQYKYAIVYSYKTVYCDVFSTTNYQGCVYFDTEEVAKKAIEEFHDELVWYFTEYRDSCGLPEQEKEPEIQKFSTDELLEELKRRMESKE